MAKNNMQNNDTFVKSQQRSFNFILRLQHHNIFIFPINTFLFSQNQDILIKKIVCFSRNKKEKKNNVLPLATSVVLKPQKSVSLFGIGRAKDSL